MNEILDELQTEEPTEMSDAEAVDAIDGLLNPQQPEAEEEAEAQEEGEVEEGEVQEGDQEAEEEIQELPIETLDDIAEALGASPDDVLEQVKIKIKVDGKEQEVTLGELRNGYQREADYTQKTQKVSAKVRDIENQETQLLEFKKYVHAMSQENPWAQAEQQVQQEYQSTDWARLEQEDPIEAATLHNRLQRQAQSISAAKQQHQQRLGQLFNTVDQAEVQIRQGEMAKLAQATGWTQDDIEANKQQLASFLVNRGYSEAAVNSIRHASVVADLEKLRKLEAQQQTTKNVIDTKKAKKVVRVLKSSARKTGRSGPSDKYKNLVKRAKQTQSDDAWANALAEKLSL